MFNGPGRQKNVAASPSGTFQGDEGRWHPRITRMKLLHSRSWCGTWHHVVWYIVARQQSHTSCCRDLTKVGIFIFDQYDYGEVQTLQQPTVLFWRHCQQKSAANVRHLGFCGLPWESDSSSAFQAVHWFLCKQKVHCRIHNSRPIFLAWPILTQSMRRSPIPFQVQFQYYPSIYTEVFLTFPHQNPIRSCLLPVPVTTPSVSFLLMWSPA